LKAIYSLGINPFPTGDKSLSRSLSFPEVAGMTDPMQRPFDSLLIHSFDVIEYIAGFVSPTPLNQHMAID
jgi:hypothetical protein